MSKVLVLILLLLATLLSGLDLAMGHGSRFDGCDSGAGSSWRGGRGGGGWRGGNDNHDADDDDDDGGGDHDPYRILQVPRGCSTEEIRQAYRARCLTDHPDKTLHLSPEERRSRENRFKRVQRAYETIGDPDKRRQYDLLYRRTASENQFFRSSFSGPASSSLSPSDVGDDSFRYYFPFASNAFFWGSSPFGRAVPGGFGSFYNGDYYFRQQPHEFHHRRGRRPMARRRKPMGLFGRPAPPAVFVQHVPVPLEELYRGGTVRNVRLDATTWWRRVAAAVRGGAAPWITYHALLYSLPLVHFSQIWALGCALYVFHQLLPTVESTNDKEQKEEKEHRTFSSIVGTNRKSKLYSLKIEPGYKGGTKFMYTEENFNAQVVFVLEESPHRLYQRVGNDLHATVALTAEQAREGCVISLPSLDPAEPDISVRIPPGLAPRQRRVARPTDRRGEGGASSNTLIVLEGHGWPIRRQKASTGSGGSSRRQSHQSCPTSSRKKGDLIVHVCVDSSSHPHKNRMARDQAKS
jgi:DnaJ-class molecular chaperone